MRDRLGLIIPFGLFGAFFLVYSIVWMISAGVMKDEIVAFAAREDERGRSFAYDGIKVAGYPMSLRAKIADASWTDGEEFGLTSSELQVIALPYDVSRILFAPQGERTITLFGTAYDLDAENLLFSIERDFAAAEGQNFSLVNDERTVTFSNLIINRQNLNEGDTIAADVRDIDFGGELSIRVPVFQLSAGLTGQGLNIGAMDLAIGREDDPAPTSFQAEGVLTYDDAGLLSGELDVTFVNERPVIMLLAELGVFGSGQAQLIAGGLSLLTDGGTRPTTLPLVIDKGEVYLTGLPIGRLPLGTIPPLAD